MKNFIIILTTIFVTGSMVSTVCFRACKKRVKVNGWDIRTWEVVDSDWEYFIRL